MQFLSMRCLNCQSLGGSARLGGDVIPYCSQCLSEPNLGISQPQQLQLQLQLQQLQQISPPQDDQLQQLQRQRQYSDHNDLIRMFSQNLNLGHQYPAAGQAPLTPPETSPTSANFSISQHYHHSVQQTPPSPKQELPHLALGASQHMHSEFRDYTMTAAPADTQYEIVDTDTYNSMALDENCSAMEMLRAGERERERKDAVYATNPWDNDYYGSGGGVDFSDVDVDEESLCSIYGASSVGGACRLKPFEL